MTARVLIVVGAKGGSGASTVALELARRLQSGASRVLVDGDLAGRRTHAVALDLVAELDAGHLPGVPALAHAHGHAVIELTASYEDGFLVRPAALETVLAPLASDATYVVDAPQPFAAAVRPLVARALRFVVVAEPTLLGINGARASIATMTRFGIPAARVALVVNPRDGVRELSRNDIQNALGIPVFAELPLRRDRGYVRAVAALAEALDRLPILEPLPDLRTATAFDPIGDRRAEPRDASTPPPRQARAGDEPPAPPVASADETLKAELHAAIMSKIDFVAAARVHTDAQKMAELQAQVMEIAEALLAERKEITSVEEASRLKAEIVGEALGLGPLETFLDDPAVTEIMVNGYRNVFVERHGRIERTSRRFADDRQVRLVIERIIAPLGRRIDEASPMVDARLPDGSRVNAIIEPLSIDGPTLTIRRFGKRRLRVEDLVALGALTNPVVDFLRAAVEARLNVVVSGGTGSGKTTLLGALSGFIPRSERIVTIEDAAELSLDQPHVVRLESRPPNLEGRGEIRIRELVRNALRMRPDRIVVGECRGGEALDMLQAMNTGHDGSLTTIHANTARDALSRIETMVMMAGFDLPVRAIREQVSSAIDIVVQVGRLRDGSRRVISVAEVVGMEGDIVTMQDIVRYRQRGVDAEGKVLGAFESTGVQPSCLRRFEEAGIGFDPTSLGSMQPVAEAAWAAR